MEQDKSTLKTPLPPQKKVKKTKDTKETEIFKRKYFDYYDDIKTSVKEDW